MPCPFCCFSILPIKVTSVWLPSPAYYAHIKILSSPQHGSVFVPWKCKVNMSIANCATCIFCDTLTHEGAILIVEIHQCAEWELTCINRIRTTMRPVAIFHLPFQRIGCHVDRNCGTRWLRSRSWHLCWNCSRYWRRRLYRSC